MTRCIYCDSTKVQSRGTRITKSGKVKNRYQCQSCNEWFSKEAKESATKFSEDTNTTFHGYKKFVITGVQNDTQVNEKLLKTLEAYCDKHNAKLILIPINYQYPHDSAYRLEDRMQFSSFELCDKLRVMASVHISPAIENPLSSLDGLSKGDSLIVASTTLQMRTMATLGTSPAILHTTGAITHPNMSDTKQGLKAKFNHSFSALVVEVDNDMFHLRTLNSGLDGSFYDVDGFYSGSKFNALEVVKALVLGDVHAASVSDAVVLATFVDQNSMVNCLKPEQIVLHDLLDFGSGSHHGRDVFTKYSKHVNNKDVVEDELFETIDFIRDFVPSYTKVVIVDSNHNQHFDRWLQEFPTHDNSIQNAMLYHKMMFLKFDSFNKEQTYTDAFELWTKHCYPDELPDIVWSGDEGYRIGDVECGLHGDVGANGARGAPISFAKMPMKLIVGHSHSPSIYQGNYTVGTSSKLKMGYNNSGASSWMNSHCIIYNNGRRQMINIINGKWKS
jgi:hypothetical protein